MHVDLGTEKSTHLMRKTPCMGKNRVKKIYRFDLHERTIKTEMKYSDGTKNIYESHYYSTRILLG